MVPDNSVLLEGLRGNPGFGSAMLFSRPHAILRADSLDAVLPALDAAEQYRLAGYYLAGYVAYEAGYAFEERLRALPAGKGPLVWLGVYDRPVPGSLSEESLSPVRIPSEEAWTISPSFWAYRLAIAAILDSIAQGDVYQINYTGLIAFPFEGDPFSLYRQLRLRQKTDYAAYVRHDTCHVLSLSPELFFQVRRGKITTKPMKGTIRRGRTAGEDRLFAHQLRTCPKNRAENTMIVDLLRNDLGRVCETGSVTAESLFDVERYETLHQMTSTISGQLRQGIGIPDLFRNLFPCGSVTGAPKLRAMEIIHELEYAPRGIYTGAIGYAAPDGDLLFNVAIRTVMVEDGVAVLGVGSGIVADSDPDAEYRECRLKAAFLSAKMPADRFHLVETMRFEQGIRLLPLHLDRLQASAEYFDFPLDREMIKKAILSHVAGLDPDTIYKIRLLLAHEGTWKIEVAAVDTDQALPVRIGLSAHRVSSDTVFQYHKTTVRDVYNSELNQAHEKGLFDVLFLNERDEVTEGCITNVFVETGGRLLTPPVSCGLLEGVYRRYVLETNRDAGERVLTLHDLRHADRLFVCNAVRGMLPAVLVEDGCL